MSVDVDFENDANIDSLRSVIKWEIQHLLTRLSCMGEETLVLSVSIVNGCMTKLGSSAGLGFLSITDCNRLKEDFLAYCHDFHKVSEDNVNDVNFDETGKESGAGINHRHGIKRKTRKKDYLKSTKLSKLCLNGESEDLINQLKGQGHTDQCHGDNCDNDLDTEINYAEDLKELKSIVKSRRKRIPQKLPIKDTCTLPMYIQTVDSPTNSAGGELCLTDNDCVPQVSHEKTSMKHLNDGRIPSQFVGDLTSRSEACKTEHVESADCVEDIEAVPLDPADKVKNQNLVSDIKSEKDPKLVDVNSDVGNLDSVALVTEPCPLPVFPDLRPNKRNVSYNDDVYVDELLGMSNLDRGFSKPTYKKSNTGKSMSSLKKQKEQNCDTHVFVSRKKGMKTNAFDEVFAESTLLNACKMHCGRYQCPLCEQKTRDRHDLKRHLRTHTKEKPFQCDICERKFTRKWDLENHVTRHLDKDFNCSVSGSMKTAVPCKKYSGTDLSYNKLIRDLLEGMNMNINSAATDVSKNGILKSRNDDTDIDIVTSNTRMGDDAGSDISNFCLKSNGEAGNKTEPKCQDQKESCES